MTSATGWGFILDKLIDDALGTARLLAVVALCIAAGTAVFGLASPPDRSGALAWAAVMLVFGLVCSVLWWAAARCRIARRGREGTRHSGA